ncbi:hypothetical protein OAK05_05775 [Gammaproteobacteria bacterium]|nr:hypothetical protein [Gammaproteobacteria bacterium]
MSTQSKVSPEELAALLPQYEVSLEKMSRVEKKIRNRCILISVLWIVRTAIVMFYPEFVLVTRAETRLLSSDDVSGLLLVRLVMLSIGVGVYLWSFLTNHYFRTINVLALIIVSCLIWSDIEVYVLSSMADLTLPSLGMILFRFIPLTLLFLNYLDIRK